MLGVECWAKLDGELGGGDEERLGEEGCDMFGLDYGLPSSLLPPLRVVDMCIGTLTLYIELSVIMPFPSFHKRDEHIDEKIEGEDKYVSLLLSAPCHPREQHFLHHRLRRVQDGTVIRTGISPNSIHQQYFHCRMKYWMVFVLNDPSLLAEICDNYISLFWLLYYGYPCRSACLGIRYP